MYTLKKYIPGIFQEYDNSKEYIQYIPGIYQVEFENILGIYVVYDNVQ